MSDVPDLKDIADNWAKSQILILSPSWKGEPKAAYYVESLVATWPQVRDSVVALLNDPRPLVVAYSLLTARRANDRVLCELKTDLLQSKAGITAHEGSFRIPTDLGSLARKWAKEIASQNEGAV